jgi:hypothetical protein
VQFDGYDDQAIRVGQLIDDPPRVYVVEDASGIARVGRCYQETYSVWFGVGGKRAYSSAEEVVPVRRGVSYSALGLKR